MSEEFMSSDIALLDVLRKHGPLSVSELADALSVTATAVRQRLTRLRAQGLILRTTIRAGRGRPSHRYGLTEAGRRKAGENFADLSVALWEEIRAIRDPEVRQGLIARISRRLAATYAGQVNGSTIAERMAAVAQVFSQRSIPFEVERTEDLPILHAMACPYPGLAEHDRSVCAMERLLFQQLLGCDLRLSSCRLDGDSCCTFDVRQREGRETADSGPSGSSLSLASSDSATSGTAVGDGKQNCEG